MKNIFLFLCTLLTTALSSQNTTTWFPPGAKWQYHYESISGPGLEIFEQVGMEVVGGQLCAKLHWYGYHQGWPSGPNEFGYQYLYAENDAVYQWTGDSFQLLYDFKRQAGDAFILTNSVYDAGRIDSTGVALQWGIPVRFQDISLYSASLDDTLIRRVYERLGGQQHLLYWDNGSQLSEIDYTLTCYRDNEYPEPDCNFMYDLDYQAFPSGNATWSEEYGSFCSFRGYQYKMEGDTMISGVGTGKKLYFRDTYYGTMACPHPININLQEPYRLAGLLSQNVLDKKVFFTRLTDAFTLPICVSLSENEYFPLHQTVLLYDFDLAVGDVIAWRGQPNTVLYIDSLQLKDGTWRRTFHFDAQGYYFWIEGIGSNLGLFNSYDNFLATDISCSLNCFREDNQLKYPATASDAALCDSLVVATSDPKGLHAQMKLYPNPTTGAVTLELPADALPALARLFDTQGRELDRREITEIRTPWTLPESGASKLLFLYLQTPDARTGGRALRVE